MEQDLSWESSVVYLWFYYGTIYFQSNSQNYRERFSSLATNRDKDDKWVNK